jgi:DNA-binding NarL/FixJ family response regulator
LVLNSSDHDIEACLERLIEGYLNQHHAISILRTDGTQQKVAFPNRHDLDGIRASLYEGMSKRQKQVTRLVVEGLSNDEIAQRIGVVSGVVAARLTEIYNMFDALPTHQFRSRPNRSGLIAFFGDYFSQHPED